MTQPSTHAAPTSQTLSATTTAQRRCLTPQATACLDRWVVANASQLAVQSLSAWHRYAEGLARSTPAGQPVVIEMDMSTTKSGYPEELRCPPEWFVER